MFYYIKSVVIGDFMIFGHNSGLITRCWTEERAKEIVKELQEEALKEHYADMLDHT